MYFLALFLVAAINLLIVSNASLAKLAVAAIYSPIITSFPQPSPVLSASTTTLLPNETATPAANKSPATSTQSMTLSGDEGQLETNKWGSTEKIGEHLYRTHVGSDGVTPTPSEIFQALNKYRSDHRAGALQQDEKLCDLAQKRAEEQDQAGGLDSHTGFKKYLEDSSHWLELNVTGLGENSSWNYELTATHLIEWIFNADDEHRNNQLNPDWTLMCAATSGKTVDIIFGKR